MVGRCEQSCRTVNLFTSTTSTPSTATSAVCPWLGLASTFALCWVLCLGFWKQKLLTEHMLKVSSTSNSAKTISMLSLTWTIISINTTSSFSDNFNKCWYIYPHRILTVRQSFFGLLKKWIILWLVTFAVDWALSNNYLSIFGLLGKVDYQSPWCDVTLQGWLGQWE